MFSPQNKLRVTTRTDDRIPNSAAFERSRAGLLHRGDGFTGHSMNALGSVDDMLAAREDLARQAKVSN
jgi:hypothetical protein